MNYTSWFLLNLFSQILHPRLVRWASSKYFLRLTWPDLAQVLQTKASRFVFFTWDCSFYSMISFSFSSTFCFNASVIKCLLFLIALPFWTVNGHSLTKPHLEFITLKMCKMLTKIWNYIKDISPIRFKVLHQRFQAFSAHSSFVRIFCLQNIWLWKYQTHMAWYMVNLLQ